ncbi:MAG: helix-turn-helix transcriptional regulator [Candidatus Izemoplasmatales bacterium]|nr:helix-turn-helix transcriptional regulator [Candidatus Izemoplasmatales bacterium]MDD5293945.1 helix-turn-helix transcriptional regulator [Candidatus Izemoplasmatales bacterium]
MNGNILKDNLIYLRKIKGRTQKELARDLNYSDKVISKWERGESIPDVSALNHIAMFFGVTIDELVSAVLSENAAMRRDAIIDYHITKGPSELMKKSIWIALAVYVLMLGSVILWFDWVMFLAVHFGLIIYLIFHQIIVQNIVVMAQYEGHEIRVNHRATKVSLYIDQRLVDEMDNTFAFNCYLSGKIQDKKIKVRISMGIDVKIRMFVE